MSRYIDADKLSGALANLIDVINTIQNKQLAPATYVKPFEGEYLI